MPRSRSRSPQRPPRYDSRSRAYGDRDRRRDYRDDRRDSEYNRERGRDNYSREKHGNHSRKDRSPRGHRSHSPRNVRSDDQSREYHTRKSGGEPGPSMLREDVHSLRSKSRSQSHSPEPDKTKPNFKPSGLLAAETNTVRLADGTSTFLKYNEPPEARKPTQSWRLYVFKGKDEIDLLHIHRQSCYLIGRDRTICDIPLEHPSCSKQHAAIQFRHIPEKDEFGNVKATVKPFIIDLESTNGTFVNDEQIPVSRYYELRLNDVVKFGLSFREYVLLHEDV